MSLFRRALLPNLTTKWEKKKISAKTNFALFNSITRHLVWTVYSKQFAHEVVSDSILFPRSVVWFFWDSFCEIYLLYIFKLMKALWHQSSDKITFPANISCKRRANARGLISEWTKKSHYLPFQNEHGTSGGIITQFYIAN